MSNFYCEHCGAVISDTPRGYVTGCEHYPLERRSRVSSSPLPRKLDELMTTTLAGEDDWDPDDSCEI